MLNVSTKTKKISISADKLAEMIRKTNEQGNCSVEDIDYLYYVPVHVLMHNLGVKITVSKKSQRSK